MLLRSRGGNKDVVDVREDIIKINKGAIYVSLKRLARVAEAKGHHRVFEKAE